MKKYLGSCLCKEIVFEFNGEFKKFFLCHCSRCRKATGSAHAANLFLNTAEFKWVKGEPLVKTYRLSNTRFVKSFCAHCGSALPTVGQNNSILIPAGSLDCDVDISPQGHIHMSSKANWDQNLEQVEKFNALP
jgi:hypothetical protein